MKSFQEFISNDIGTVEGKLITGIIGEIPSKTARSPKLWNPAFERLKLEAVFLPFDVSKNNLESLINALKQDERVLGFSVTNPYKSEIIKYLDEIDEIARQIDAVNTVVRSKDGKIKGYNTDGKGFIDSLLIPHPGYDKEEPFLDSLRLEGKKILVIGAGGASKSVSFYLAKEIGKDGRIYIANRTLENARSITSKIESFYKCAATPIDEIDIAFCLSNADILVNASIKGSDGLKQVDGRYFCLRNFSSLAPATPIAIPRLEDEDDTNLLDRIDIANRREIQKNKYDSTRLFINLPKDKKLHIADIIHTPAETILLAQAGHFGHSTMNGIGMNIMQAVDSFYKIMNSYLYDKGYSNEAYNMVKDTMFSVK